MEKSVVYNGTMLRHQKEGSHTDAILIRSSEGDSSMPALNDDEESVRALKFIASQRKLIEERASRLAVSIAVDPPAEQLPLASKPIQL